MKYEIYVNFLIWNKFSRYTRPSQKRKFNSAHNTIPFENKKGSMYVIISRIHKILIPPGALGERLQL